MECVLTLGVPALPSLVINLEKKSRIVLSVKRTTKEGKETYLLCFETLSNTGVCKPGLAHNNGQSFFVSCFMFIVSSGSFDPDFTYHMPSHSF
jgi:hypothetical protein